MVYPPHSDPFSPLSPPSLNRQSKVIMQRQYREKEGKCFDALRDAIKRLTGEELQTRLEVLKKAIDLLFAFSAVEQQSAEEADVPPGTYGTFPFANALDTTVTQAHLGYSAEPSHHWPETWQTNAELDVQSLFDATLSYAEQYNSASNMGFALAQTNYGDYGESWSDYVHR